VWLRLRPVRGARAVADAWPCGARGFVGRGASCVSTCGLGDAGSVIRVAGWRHQGQWVDAQDFLQGPLGSAPVGVRAGKGFKFREKINFGPSEKQRILEIFYYFLLFYFLKNLFFSKNIKILIRLGK
jgi:hypothetical protein